MAVASPSPATAAAAAAEKKHWWLTNKKVYRITFDLYISFVVMNE